MGKPPVHYYGLWIGNETHHPACDGVMFERRPEYRKKSSGQFQTSDIKIYNNSNNKGFKDMVRRWVSREQRWQVEGVGVEEISQVWGCQIFTALNGMRRDREVGVLLY